MIKKWLQYTLIGAFSYPAILILFFLLAFITTPFGLRPFFEQSLKFLVLPASFPSLKLVYILIENPINYAGPIIGFISLFSLLIGALMGLIIFFIRNIFK